MSAPRHLLMPKLGLTMEEGRIAKWAVAPGARFAAGDIIVVIETDKIANDVEAPAAGVLVEQLAPEGAVLPVSSPIASWRPEAGCDPRPAAPDSGAAGLSEHKSTGAAPAGSGSDAPCSTQQNVTGESRAQVHRLLATPYARRLARESGVDLGTVTGTGPRGRIKATDVLRTKTMPVHVPLARTISFPEAAAGGRPGPRRGDHSTSVSPPEPLLTVGNLAPTPTTDLVPRAAVGKEPGTASPLARALSQAQIEIDTRGIREVSRSTGNTAAPEVGLALVVMACVRAMEALPSGAIGIEIAAGGVTSCARLDIGAGASLRSVASEIARSRSEAALDWPAGTLLVSQGTEHTQLYAPAAPEGWSAMLGLGAEREVLRRAPDSSIASVNTMTLALSYDAARIENGAALAFLSTLKKLIEEPLAMLAG